MKFSKRVDTASFGASYTGAPFKVESEMAYAVLASWGGNPTGTLTLEASNDAFLDNVNNDVNPNATWVTITGSSYALSGAPDTYFVNASDVAYLAFRVKFARSGGTGTATILINAKGWI